ncbi:MAG: OmpH family outer membrane protein [Bacteroidales bacterium]|nr:OmpH family outer membrane protein [Bacteroidales bacterium]
MKKSVLFLMIGAFAIIAFAFYNPMNETKVGHIDSEYVFSKIPAYQDAQDELENLSNQFRAEIEAKYKIVDSLYQAYQKEEVLLPHETKILKQNEIIDKEQEAKDLQQRYFGQGGLMDDKREELLKPIQDNVYTALEQLATTGNFDYIFDKTTGEILYAKDAKDQSDALVRQLGY